MPESPAIYLASSSPRRRQLLAQIGINFSLLQVDVDESQRPGEVAVDYVQRLALDKARAGWHLLDVKGRRPVMGADTAVVADGMIMGKPGDRAQGVAMLQSLSGRSHEVLSAVALVASREVVSLSSSSVTFRKLSPEECQSYWDTGEPLDKAGGYAIQGLAAVFASRLEGSYSGVMGLPLYETARLLNQFGIIVI